ncbi:MAG: DUF3990 domain-containing protein [Dysgonamonadaceae bacterium]|jgi:hypothetical protein|nr:DUF3990 domain-containing protein [Dysgonamonadaceae bacterium]
MRVYHGSDVRIEEINLAKSGNFKDFGRGFYVTNIRKHAHARALDIAATNGTQPIVTEFEYIEAYPVTMGMRLKKFETISQEWIEFIVMNRNRRIAHPTHAYDIVEGAIADDWVTTQIDRYLKGKISVETLIEKIKYREFTHQICFCTVESLFALELVDDDRLFEIEDISNEIIKQLAIENNLSELDAIRMFLNSRTYENLTNPTATMQNISLQIIYEMFKQELAALQDTPVIPVT